MTITTITPQKEKRTLKSFFPIVEWLPKYKSSWLRFDVIAALTVWALVVPEAMAYAGIAGMPPEAGLYAAPLALIGYAIFGTSKHLNVGPSSTVAALSFSVVVGLAGKKRPERPAVAAHDEELVFPRRCRIGTKGDRRPVRRPVWAEVVAPSAGQPLHIPTSAFTT